MKKCPYPGLRPFNENEAIYFKGRDLHIRQITKQLEERKVIMITGASGDGKSSLVYAGLIPNAKAGFFRAEFNNWIIADFKPERTPLNNLAQALACPLKSKAKKLEEQLQFGFSSLVNAYKSSPSYVEPECENWQNADDKNRKELIRKSANLLIVADQFEEFFTNKENFNQGLPSEKAYVTVNLLLETARIARQENLPIYVVFTMRSDFIGQCVAFKGLPEAIGYSQFFVPRLKRNELKQVIEEPAVLLGGRVSNRLTEVLINDLQGGGDQLPVLQHTLKQLWELAEHGTQKLDFIHLAKLAGISSKLLDNQDKMYFDKWFADLPLFKKKYFDAPSIANVLNTHANILFETAHIYFNEQVSWAKYNINAEDARQILKTAFQSLTKIDNGRAVRNRVTLKEITKIINQPNITINVVCGVINIFRLPDNSFVRPFIHPDDIDTQYLSAETTFDITHEALLRNWQVLQLWNKEEEINLYDFEDFKIQLNRWLGTDKSQKFLLASGPLKHFEKWYEECKPNAYWISKYDTSANEKKEKIKEAEILTSDIEEYLEQSRKQINKIKRAKNRRINYVVSSAIVVIAILMGIVAWAVFEKTNAQKQEQLAAIQRNEAILQRFNAEKERNNAIKANKRAEQNAMQAIVSKKESDLARKLSEKMRLLAEEKSVLAQREANKAKKEKMRAESQRKLAEIASDSANTLSILATAQSMAFKAQQDFKDVQFNYIVAYYAYWFHSLEGGHKRDATIFNALRYALDASGYNDKLYDSASPLVNISLADYESLILMEDNGKMKTLDPETSMIRTEETFKGEIPLRKVFHLQDYMLASFEDGTAKLLSLDSGESQKLTGYKAFINDVLRIDSILVVAGKDEYVELWDIHDLSQGVVCSFFTGSRVNKMAMAGNKIFAGLKDGDVISFDLETREFTILDKLESRITALNIGLDENLMMYGTSKGRVKVIDLNHGNKVLHELNFNERMIESTAISYHSTLFAIASSDKKVQIFDLDNRQKKPLVINNYKYGIKNMFFNKNDELVALCEDNSIRVWKTDCDQYARMVKSRIERMPTQEEWVQLVGNYIDLPQNLNGI